MSEEEAPKSAYELAMERLRRKDKDAGVEERSLTEDQKQRLAEVRRFYGAKLAEREILFRSDRRRAESPEALQKLEEDYQRDRERLTADQDAKLEKVRREGREP